MRTTPLLMMSGLVLGASTSALDTGTYGWQYNWTQLSGVANSDPTLVVGSDWKLYVCVE